MERLGDLPEAPADEDEPADPLRVLAVVLERDLAAHRVPDEDARRVADELPDAREIVGVRRDVDPIRVGGRSAPPVPAVVPVGEWR